MIYLESSYDFLIFNFSLQFLVMLHLKIASVTTCNNTYDQERRHRKRSGNFSVLVRQMVCDHFCSFDLEKCGPDFSYLINLQQKVEYMIAIDHKKKIDCGIFALLSTSHYSAYGNCYLFNFVSAQGKD